jgi:hypothetical protein
LLTNRLAACPTARQCQDGCNSTSTVLICQVQKGHNTPCQTSKAFGVAAWQSVDLSSGSLASCTTEVSEFNAGEGSPEIQARPHQYCLTYRMTGLLAGAGICCGAVCSVSMPVTYSRIQLHKNNQNNMRLAD